MVRRWFVLAGLSLCFLNPAAQADDPPGKQLEETATRIRVAKESLKHTVESALSKAGKLPVDAGIVVLQSAENDVNEANFLTAAEKKEFTDQLTAKRKAIESGLPASKPAPATTSKEENQTNEKVREELNLIKTLDKQGHVATAKARLKALMDKYPQHPALLAYATVTSRQDIARDYNRLNADRNTSTNEAMSDIVKSAGNVPPNGTIKYDKEAFDKASKREPVGSVFSKLTGREKEILRTLDQPSKTDFSFNNTSFDQVIKSLEKELGFQLVISKATMEEVRLSYESTLTYEIPRNVSKRNLLKSVLSELGLTYIIKGEIVQVVSFLQAKNEMRVGVMDVASLINGVGAQQNVNQIINLIKTTVEPDSWEGAGGNGTITFHPPGTLIIKNSAEVIYQLGARPRSR
ncbi:MAG: DUF4974 domain-containing protein [Planctomycetia bacterium]|nr:DUF4974 domain-containing protein [Planctomycetia bacterium]